MKRLMEGLHALAHSPEPSFESVDLNQLARAVLVHLTPSLTAKLVKEFHEVPPVRADPTLLKQVFTNLLLNAEDAIDAGGEIRVSTRSVDGMVACAVADNGRGIAPEFLATRLFKPFATTKSHGFGIGLYQSKTIIEAHGGRLQAESQVGRGSTLTFTLPVLTRTDGR
jgi:signal transduction histidine kinase